MIKTINNVLIDSEEIQVFDKRLTVCPVCGKEFLPNDLGSYCYKQINNFKRVRYCCSWSCHRKCETILYRNNPTMNNLIDLENYCK